MIKTSRIRFLERRESGGIRRKGCVGAVAVVEERAVGCGHVFNESLPAGAVFVGIVEISVITLFLFDVYAAREYESGVERGRGGKRILVQSAKKIIFGRNNVANGLLRRRIRSGGFCFCEKITNFGNEKFIRYERNVLRKHSAAVSENRFRFF